MKADGRRSKAWCSWWSPVLFKPTFEVGPLVWLGKTMGPLPPHTPLTELVARIRRRDVSPVEVLRGCLDRIERHNGALNAIVALHADRALDAARDAEQRLMRGEDLGPLGGVPFAVQDLEDVAGMRTTYGSPLFVDNVAAADSINVARLRAA